MEQAGDDPCRHAVVRVPVRSAGDKLGMVVEDVVHRDCAQHIERRRLARQDAFGDLPYAIQPLAVLLVPGVISGAGDVRLWVGAPELGSARQRAAERCQFRRRQCDRLDRSADLAAHRSAERRGSVGR